MSGLNNPYIRGRFIVDGIVRKLSSEMKDLYPKIKIYAEKTNSIKPPYLFVSTQNIITSRHSRWLNFKDYLILIYGRFVESSYESLDELGCFLTEALEYIELPLANSLKQGPQETGEIYPVRGTNMNNHISIDSGYSEMYFYTRYRLQVFRENPVEPLMMEETINIEEKQDE